MILLILFRILYPINKLSMHTHTHTQGVCM